MESKIIRNLLYLLNKHDLLKRIIHIPVRQIKKVRSYPQVKKQYERICQILDSNTHDYPKIWYFCVAQHANLGDLAQRYCIENWLEENYPDYKVIEVPTKVVLLFKKKICKQMSALINPKDVIIFQSGYTMSDIHPDDLVRKVILRRFKDNPVLIFPQTVLYKTRKKKEQMHRLLRMNQKLLLLTRDEISFQYVKAEFSDVRSMLFPDIVTTLIGRREEVTSERKGIGLCVRNDGEKFYSYKQINNLKVSLEKMDSVEVTDTNCTDIGLINRDSIRRCLEQKVLSFAQKKVIITDRYHGTILSLVSNTPVIVIKTNDHKVTTGVQWFNEIYNTNIYYCENLEEVPSLVKKIYETADYKPLKSYFKEEYYDHLREIFTREIIIQTRRKEEKQKFNGICNDNQCTGCMACLNICPQQAISVGTDERGFYIPVINRNLCTDCGVCRKICPALSKPIGNHESKKVYAMWSKDPILRKDSSSGAVFSGLAKWILEQDGLVYGCALNEEHVAEHICISSLEELDQLRGSKYVQSRIGDIYSSVKVALKEGWKVLFTGTPCQIAGLKAFLGNTDCTNLYTMDIICHGVPSPMAFSDYMKASEEKQGARAKSISFRHKDPGWTNFSMRIEYEDEQIYQEIGRKDPYLNAFLKDCLTRDCCHTCPYTSTRRMGDLTTGDFWSYVSVSHKVRNDEKGISLVLVNNEKGQRMLQAIKKDYVLQERTVSEGKRGNRCLSRPYPPSASKDLFWKTYLADRDFLKAADQCVPKKKPSLKHRISEEVNRYYYLLPGFAKKTFQKMLKMK